MATKSPGVYLSEIENTTYINPSTVQTSAAVVGFASKGPVGEPTLINSYNTFKNVFGGPTEIANSTIAARSILNISDNLIFTRVADNSVSASNTIIKNGIEASNGKTFFNKTSDILIGTNGYNFSSIYTFDALTYDGDQKKTFYIRSPSNSKLTQASILSQISQQLNPTPGTYEIKCGKNGVKGGIYSFDILVDNVSIFGASSEDDPIFITLPEGANNQVLAESLNQAINDGSNATYSLTVVPNFGDNMENGVRQIVKATDQYMGADNEEKQFYLRLNDNNDSVAHRISIRIASGDETTYQYVADVLGNYLKNTHGVEVFFEEGNLEETDPITGDIIKPLKDSTFLFVRKDKGAGKTVEVLGINYNEVPEGSEVIVSDALDLFAGYDGTVDNIPPYMENPTSIAVSGIKSTVNKVPENLNFSVSYNTNTKSVILTTDEIGTNSTTNKGPTIEIGKAKHGKWLLDEDVNFGSIIGSVEGQNGIDIKVYRDEATKAIAFESKESVEPPTIVKASTISPYLDLFSLLNEISEKEGNTFIDAAYKDILVVTTLDKGSGTKGIVVRKYSVMNPITNQLKYGIEIWDNGALKETYDDISLVYNDIANRFDTRINNTPENGGSNLIQIEVVKNDFADPLVQFKDGEYAVGAANKATDISRDPDVSINAYALYDYSVGTDGIPEDSDSLFEEALDIEGKLSNTDLYNYHILITPDNINPVVQDAAIALAESRKDFIYLVDPPFGLSVSSVTDWHNGKGYGRGTVIDSTYAALYWPWIKVYDNDNKRYSWVPPSTMMAAKLVTLDNTKGCWFAPAGESNGRFNVGDIEYSAKQSERDTLYTNYNRVNPIIKYNDGSIIIFGEKTLHRENSSLTKVHTRRMVVDLKKKVRAALRPFLFLPNIQTNWAKCAALINSILEVYKVGGGITYYKVTIDSTTTTAELMQQDIMSGLINIVPAGVIEQIELQISLDKSAESVNVLG